MPQKRSDRWKTKVLHQPLVLFDMRVFALYMSTWSVWHFSEKMYRHFSVGCLIGYPKLSRREISNGGADTVHSIRNNCGENFIVSTWQRGRSRAQLCNRKGKERRCHDKDITNAGNPKSRFVYTHPDTDGNKWTDTWLSRKRRVWKPRAWLNLLEFQLDQRFVCLPILLGQCH